MEKINIFCIFSRHFSTLRDHSTGKLKTSDFLVFYIVPIMIAFAISFFISDDFLTKISTELITFYSVLGGFMLNLLVLVYGFDAKKFQTPKVAQKVLRQTTANISYLITLASIVILVLFFINISGYVDGGVNIVIHGVDIVVYIKQFLVVFIISSLLNFGLTLFMVLRRFYGLDFDLKDLF